MLSLSLALLMVVTPETEQVRRMVLTDCISSSQAVPGQLRMVHVMFRHGDRTPISHYPTDPWADPHHWPVGPGQLTSLGKRQHFQLGQWLRQTYGGGRLLGEVYSEQEVTVRSTDVDRTLMSAGANLAGLFPPTGYMKWNPDLSWQPVPVHTLPLQEDFLLSSTHSACPRLVRLREEVEASDWLREVYRENRDLLHYLSRHTGEEIDTVLKLDWLYDTLLVEQLYNKVTRIRSCVSGLQIPLSRRYQTGLTKSFREESSRS